ATALTLVAADLRAVAETRSHQRSGTLPDLDFRVGAAVTPVGGLEEPSWAIPASGDVGGSKWNAADPQCWERRRTRFPPVRRSDGSLAARSMPAVGPRAPGP